MVRSDALGERRGAPSIDRPSSLARRPSAAPTSHGGGRSQVNATISALKAQTSGGVSVGIPFKAADRPRLPP